MSWRFLVLPLLGSCETAGPTSTDTGAALSGEDTGAEHAISDEVPTPPLLQALADHEARAAWGSAGAAGNLALPGEHLLQLYGDRDDVAALLAGQPSTGPLAGVLVDEVDARCLGRLDEIPSELALHLDTLTVLDDGLEVGGDWLPLAPCAGPALAPWELELASSRLRVEALELDADGRFLGAEADVAPPPACTSTCGSSQGYSWAGQTAYSNGSTTGTGSSCTSSSTYGYRYQCVELTERQAGRSDWAGNAYSGYWSNTGLSSSSSSQGPYYKGLLPLGSGTGYLAPQAGDIVVWKGGTYGHVGVLSAVNSSTVRVVDQNRSCGDQSCDLTYSSSGYTLGNGSGSGMCGSEGLSKYTVSGYLHRGWDFGGTYKLASSSSTGQTQHNWWLNDASYVGATTSSSVTDITDYITINPGSSDPYMTSPSGLSIPAYSSSATHGYKYVSFYIQSNCSNKTARLYWKRTSDSSFAEGRAINATISGSGWQTLTFKVSSDSDWSGTIDQIRLDPASSCSSSSTDTISIQSAWLWR